MNLINQFFILLINALRPLLGPKAACRYAIGCTEYARMQLREKKTIPALWLIIKRLLSCNPFY